MTTDAPAVVRTDFADRRETYEAALQSLFRGKPEDTEADIAKLCTPTFRFRADDDLDVDFQGFVKHIRWVREILPSQDSVSLTTTQFLRDGNQRAERHSSTTNKPDGTVGHAETFQFAQVAEDGRFEWIVEYVHRFKAKPKP